MHDALIERLERSRVPRYTSYPTAPHFTPAVDAARYAAWLDGLVPDQPLSLYLHVPWCRQLCWYCGCTTWVAGKDERIHAYAELLLREIDLVAARLPGRRTVTHLHWGGGTPGILGADLFTRLMDRLRAHFRFDADAELAIELDPRHVDAAFARALADNGINRASLGVQTFDARVQRAINRVQPFEKTQAAMAALRDVGIDSISVDLLYGLPEQTVRACEVTAVLLAGLRPSRVSLFGYAHLPSLKRHQGMIDEATLPGGRERIAQFNATSRVLLQHGYTAIGLDHFALPEDSLAEAARSGRLARNFQGYTTDRAPALIGLGTSAIGNPGPGYVQNHSTIGPWRADVMAGRLPVARGVELTAIDRANRAIIERIMCDGAVDPEAMAAAHGVPAATCRPDPDLLAELEAEGIVERQGARIVVPPAYTPLLRLVASCFDRYLNRGARRHALAI